MKTKNYLLLIGLLVQIFAPSSALATDVKIPPDKKPGMVLFAQFDLDGPRRQEEYNLREARRQENNRIIQQHKQQVEYNRQQNELARLERIRRSQESARNSIPELERKRDYLALGKAWRTLEEWDKSLDAANKAIAAYPNVVSGYTLRASLRKRLNDIPGALADYDRAIEIEPNFYGFYQIRGELKKSFDRYGAIQDFRMAMKKVRVDNRYNLIRDSELKILAKELKSLGVAE